MLKSSKGITLVALVITIIILLILAGVTLSIVMDDGLIGKAQNAVNQYDEKATNEQEQLDYLEAVFQNFIDNTKPTQTTPPASVNQ